MHERELRIAREAAADAARLVREHYARFERMAHAPVDISTAADRESQELILRRLHDEFPTDGLVAEESTPALKLAPTNSDRFWVVDPIDGTRGFATKNGEFSVMVALVEASRVVVGVVDEPALGRVTWASAGGGCWWCVGDGEPTACRISPTADLSAAALVQSHTKPGEGPSRPVRLLKPRAVVETYSAGVKMAMVARGEVELYVNTYPRFSDWDICAGHVLVTEAGGKATRLDGEALTYGEAGHVQRGGLLASNGAVHDATVRALAG